MPLNFTLGDTAYRVVSTYTVYDGSTRAVYHGPYSSLSVAKGVMKREYPSKSVVRHIESAPIGPWTKVEE